MSPGSPSAPCAGCCRYAWQLITNWCLHDEDSMAVEATHHAVLQRQKDKGKGQPPKNWKVLRERRLQVKQKLKKQADDWMRN